MCFNQAQQPKQVVKTKVISFVALSSPTHIEIPYVQNISPHNYVLNIKFNIGSERFALDSIFTSGVDNK